MNGKTLYQKLWESHVVKTYSGDTALLYIDRHLVQEVSSPVAFASLRQRGLDVRHPGKALSMVDHVNPTDDPTTIEDEAARKQIRALERNVVDSQIRYLSLDDRRQGIAHVVGPELGFTLPGISLVCGDSHTATHGAFGALAFGIGSSECEKVLATQCLTQTRAKTMRINLVGSLPAYVSAKDIALAVIRQLGTAGGAGFAIEYCGDVIEKMSMEGRMTLCNMTIEAGARIGLVAPDETTYAYLQDRFFAPKGEHWKQALAYWRTLSTDTAAVFDKDVDIDIGDLPPLVTWGTSPEHVLPIDGIIPAPASATTPSRQSSWIKAADYMQLSAGNPIQGTPIDRVFIGSCTNARIEDLRAAAEIARDRQVAKNVRAIVVPGSGLVKAQAEQEGLDRIFMSAGFEWRSAGCSMCVAMNNDRLKPGERCASTSNRNFEGRQGQGGLTHLMSPVMAAAAALKGELTDVRSLAQL